jgi:signal transduction histidine kinase
MAAAGDAEKNVSGDRDIAALVRELGVGPQSTGGVLVVDDEPLNLRVLRGFLEDRWTVHEATSGEEALAIIERVPLDVVVADQRMPGMTGVELLEKLRTLRPDVAGIVLTAYTDMASLELAINRAGAFRFLRKPWEPPDILEALEQASAFVSQRRTIEKLVQLLAARGQELRASLEEVRAQQAMLLHLERLGTIGKLAAGVAHDLRNLMVAFRALEWEVGKGAPAAVIGEILTIGLSGVENMVRTLGTLNEFSRTGSLDLNLQPVELGTVIADSVSIARMERDFRIHRVQTAVPEGLPPIRADRQKLTQVIVNLVRNALQASPREEPVRVSAAAGNGEVVIAVEDEGPGVPPEVRARLFQPFASSKGDQGLGLGLYMAQLIIVSHHGRITLVEKARGSRFEIAIPTVGAGAGA